MSRGVRSAEIEVFGSCSHREITLGVALSILFTETQFLRPQVAHLYMSCLLRRNLYLWLVGVVSSSKLFAGGGVDELAVEAGLDDGTCARGGRLRGLPRGLARVILVEGADRVEFPGRPLGLLRGLPLDLVPHSALGR